MYLPSKKKDDFLLKLNNTNEIEEEINKIYIDEYNENFEEILLKKDSDFMRYIRESVKISLEEKYPIEAFDNEIFQKIIKTTEKNIYLRNYLIDKENLINTLKVKNKGYIENGQLFFSLKHCKFQNDIPIHDCNENNNFIKVNEPNSNKIDSLICTNCLKCYKINFIKLYCDFCQINFYSKLIENENKNDSNLQPATWEKYHCHLIINEQMGCIKCKKANLYLDIKSNKLICKKCGFNSEPSLIIWTCIKCNQDFHSNVKIYNEYNFKSLSLTIKKALIDKISAVPKNIPCGHNPNLIHHKNDCPGKLYLTNFNGRKLIICSKCKGFVKYKKFIFECDECHLRFRNEITENDILIDEEIKKNKKEKEKKIIDEFYKNIIKKDYDFNNEEISTNDITNNTDNNTKDSFSLNSNSKKTKTLFSSIKENEDFLEYDIKEENDNDNKNKKDNINIGKQEEKNFLKDEQYESKKKAIKSYINEKEKNIIPLFNFDDYEIISQIGESKKSKIYCVRKTNENLFFTMKKKFIKSNKDLINYLNLYNLQYSFSKEKNITEILGINYNDEEISILTETGINSWGSEIITNKKINKFYSEKELINIIYQISIPLQKLEKNKLSHFCINPNNITVFRNNIYKISDFEHLTNISSKKIVQNDNKFISPNLYKLYHSKNTNGNIDLIKNDVYSLALCCLFCLSKNNEINSLYSDFINIDKINIVEQNIKKYINNVTKIKKNDNFYSDKFVNLICNMMHIDEITRFNFSNIINYIHKEYKLENY